jgi:hypothetical protein
MPRRKLVTVASEIEASDLRYYMLRVLATSHDLWEYCRDAECRRARRCAGEAFVCLDTPLAIEPERFVDWRG